MPGYISPNIEVYGNLARASALADYLEIVALHGKRVTRADLRDIIVENGWDSLPLSLLMVGDSGRSPIDDVPSDWVDAVRTVLGDREKHLRDAYPFEWSGEQLVVRHDANASDSPYVALLCLTAAHAWLLESEHKPTSVFEEWVAESLGTRGLDAAVIGTSAGGGFVESLRLAGESLSLRPMSDPTPRHARAKDAGVDVLAGVIWPDERMAGQLLLIGQVTVGQSQNWRTKLAQPSPPLWGGYLQEAICPMPFLAVPHHVEREHMVTLTADKRGFVLDRLRLTGHLPPITHVGRSFIQVVLEAELEM